MPSDNENQVSPDAELGEHDRLTLPKRWKWIHKVLFALGVVGLLLGIPFWGEGLAFYWRWLGVLGDMIGGLGFETWTWLMITVVQVYLLAIARNVRSAYSDLVDLSGRHLKTVRLVGELVAHVKELERRLDDVEK